MIVILEGPRGTGKTALAKAFIQPLSELGYTPTIFKSERGLDPYSDMRETLARLQVETASNPNKAVIIDRFHLTEFVMRIADGTVKRGKLIHDMVDIAYILEHLQAWVVVLSTVEMERERRVSERNDGRGDEAPAVMDAWDYAHCFLRDSENLITFNNVFFMSTDTTKADQLAKMLLVRFKIRAEINSKK